MTAHADPDTAEALMTVGGTTCLRKPFTLAQLIDAMQGRKPSG
jgi:hypothetical protein